MRGLQLRNGRAELRDDLPEPQAGPDEVRVAVRLAGVCATDLALARGYMGFAGVPGHEFVGTALDGPLSGRRVVGEINAGCGRCPECRGGDPRHCAERTVLGILGHSGAFAERLVLPACNLVPVPDEVADEVAVFTEPMAAALQIPAEIDVSGKAALVAGDGRLGLLCAHALHEAGARVTVAGRHPERAALLPDGVPLHTGWLEADAPAPDSRFELAVEATGRAEALARLLPRVAPRGTIVLKTTSERPVALDLAALVVDEQSLVGSRCGRFAPALELLATGRPPVSAMISARYDLAHADQALAHAAAGGALKVLIEVSPGA